MPAYNFVLCVGDSLVHGARDPYGSCFANELTEYAEKEFGGVWIGIEKGVNGETTADLMRRYYDQVRSYKEAYEVCLLIGTNDAKDECSTPPDRYRRNMERFYQMAMVEKRKLFIGLLPGRVNALAPSYGAKFEDNLKLYNEQIRQLVNNRKGVWGVDLTGLPDDHFADGLHFSNLGNKEVARRFGQSIWMVRNGKVPSEQYQSGVITF